MIFHSRSILTNREVVILLGDSERKVRTSKLYIRQKGLPEFIELRYSGKKSGSKVTSV